MNYLRSKSRMETFAQLFWQEICDGVNFLKLEQPIGCEDFNKIEKADDTDVSSAARARMVGRLHQNDLKIWEKRQKLYK